ncbi:unnamed protein product [Phaeothamnion confervicola]
MKCVTFIRHAVGVHNDAAACLGYDAYKDEVYSDARLSPAGVAAAREARHILGALRPPPELVITSPLTRAVQTAILLFHGTGSGEGGGGSGGGSEGGGGIGCDSSQGGTGPVVPICAAENCREGHGLHPCDRRRTRTELAAEFGAAVDFSGISETDELWRPEARESMEHLGRRAADFLAAVLRRPERHVVVVAHGVFIETLLARIAPLALDANMFFFEARSGGGCSGDALLSRASAVAAGAAAVGTVRVEAVAAPNAATAGGGPAVTKAPYYLGNAAVAAVCAAGMSLEVVARLAPLFCRFLDDAATGGGNSSGDGGHGDCSCAGGGGNGCGGVDDGYGDDSSSKGRPAPLTGPGNSVLHRRSLSLGLASLTGLTPQECSAVVAVMAPGGSLGGCSFGQFCRFVASFFLAVAHSAEAAAAAPAAGGAKSSDVPAAAEKNSLPWLAEAIIGVGDREGAHERAQCLARQCAEFRGAAGGGGEGPSTAAAVAGTALMERASRGLLLAAETSHCLRRDR